MPVTYNCIANTVLSTATNSILFSSISQSFSDLVFRFTLQTETATTGVSNMLFNGSTANYSRYEIYADVDTNTQPKASQANSRTSAQLGANTLSVTAAPTLFIGEYNLITYSSALNRNPIGIGQTATQQFGGESRYSYTLNVHQNSLSVATTSVQFTAPAGVNFAVGSQVSMYGILRA